VGRLPNPFLARVPQFSAGSPQSIGINKRSNSAADFRAFDPLSQLEAAFRQNVWQSGARNRAPKNGWGPLKNGWIVAAQGRLVLIG